MASKGFNELGWYDTRYMIGMVFAVIIVASVCLISLLFAPEEPDIKTYVNEEGLTVSEYYFPHSPNPFQITFQDSDGDLLEKWFDRNYNGQFESKAYYVNEVLSAQDVSLSDDGFYDLKRTISLEQMTERYDRNRDGHFEETRILKNGIRVLEEIDRNNDGKPEQKVLYDEKGKAVQLILDHNSDGKPETIVPGKSKEVGRGKSSRTRM